jgi:hypothetical protein
MIEVCKNQSYLSVIVAFFFTSFQPRTNELNTTTTHMPSAELPNQRARVGAMVQASFLTAALSGSMTMVAI